MVKIDHDRNSHHGFKVTFSPEVPGWRGFSVKARDAHEIMLALDHYLISPARYKHNGKNQKCPLCRHIGKN